MAQSHKERRHLGSLEWFVIAGGSDETQNLKVSQCQGAGNRAMDSHELTPTLAADRRVV